MTEIKNFDGDISVGRHAVVGGDAKVCGGVTVGKNLKVEGWLDAKNLKAANKGVFLNEESLKKAYPVPKDGWWALVGDALPAALWVAADGEWGNTGGTGGDILLESEVLADIKERLTRAQEGVDAATTKNAEQDNRLANAEGLNTKQNERLLNYVYPKLYQLNEGAGALPFDGMYSGSASVLSGRKTAAEEGYTYKVVFALKKFLLQEISPGGVTVGLYEEWDKIISGRGSSEDYAKRDCLYYVYTEGEGSYYYYVDTDGNISEKSGTYVLRKLIDKTKAEVSINTEKLDVQERYVAALNAASSEHSQKIEAIEGRAGEIEAKNSDQDKKIVSLINRLKKQEEVVVALPFDGFTDAAADSLMLLKPKDTYSYRVLFSTASNSFVLSVTENVNQTGKYIGTFSSWNAVDGAQASSYYERRDTLYKYLDLSYGAYRYYFYGEDGSFFEAPGTKYLSKIIEKQGGKIDENTQKVEELQAQVSSIEKVEDIQWGGGRHMNVFIEKGDFHIHGERTDANDGLPILNAASGHTIDARLTVLDSSLTGGTGAKTDACVTQILRLSNRMGGDGHVYVRTAQAASKAELTATDNTRWGTWEKLMGMFEKNAVENATDLDTYTTNGMYSGVFMFSGYQQNWGVAITPGSTFLLVTVNGYAVAKAGLTPQLTQMLYLLPAKDFNAHAKMYLRTAYWNVSAKSWNYQNWDKIATSNDLSPITEEVQSAKTLANNNAGRISDVEGRVSGAEGRIAAIENIIPEEYGLSTIVELGSFKNFALLLSEAAKFERVSNIGISLMHGSYLNEGSLYNGAIIIQQTNADSCTSVQYIFLESRRFTRFIRYSSTGVVEVQGVQNDGVRDIELKGGVLQLIDMWSNPIGIGATLPDDSNIYEGNATLSTVPIVMAKAQGGTVTATLMPATSARAGVMTAADKEKLDALSIGDGGGTVDNALLTEVQEKAQSALNTARAAQTAAQGAKTTANNANTAAQEAKVTADGIAAKANGASIAAAEAKTAATSAQTAATAAQTTANSAHTAAQEAKEAAAANAENIAEVREAMITNISVDGDAEGVNIIAENTLTHAGLAMKIPNADVRSNKAGVVTGTEINALYEIDLAAADVTNIGFEKDAEKNKITLTGIGQLGQYQSSGIELTPATSELAGLMSATDKIKLDSVESTANAAKSAAETAKTAADTAQETANSARETATAASTAAQEAKSAAETAQSTATAAQTKNTEQDARLDNIEARIDPDIAGRVWNEDNGTPKAESYYGSVKALRDLPKRLGLGRYIVKDDRTRRKLDPNDSRKYLDGTPAKLDGTDGQCMWCWNGFYANIWHEGSRLIKAVTFDRPVGNDISIWIPAGGISWLGAGVIDRGEAPYTDKTKWKLCSVINNSEQFRGGGGVALDASKYSKAPADTTPQITMLGMPATDISTTDFGTYARKRGEGWEANWFVAQFVVEFLFEIIMGTESSQKAFNENKDANGLYQGGFGAGVTDMPDWNNYNGSYPVIPTSVGLEAGDGVCLVPYSLPQTNGVGGDTYKTFNLPVFFGLVGAGYGHLWQWVRGLIMNAGEEQSLVYVAPSMYAAYDPSIVTDKIMVAECPRASGWIMRKSYKGLCCMPTAIGGSTNLRYSDKFYTNAETSKGLRVRAAGGYAGTVTAAGASCADATAADADAYALYSAPLCYFEEDPVIPQSQSIANN